MKTSELRKKIKAYNSGGKIPKFAYPAGTINTLFDVPEGVSLTPEQQQKYQQIMALKNMTSTEALQRLANMGEFDQNAAVSSINPLSINPTDNGLVSTSAADPTTGMSTVSLSNSFKPEVQGNPGPSSAVQRAVRSQKADGIAGSLGFKGGWKGAAATMAVDAAQAVDNALMGDKNFGSQSQAIDAAVHGTSKALMSTGNPYAMMAGAALEGANFLTKAGGQTVQGFDVPMDTSGYGNLGHMESSSSRDFGAMIGLGGLNRRAMQRKLEKRNDQARMALAAAEIVDDTRFEQEARMNSIQNTINNNMIALSGGIDTSLLGS